MKKYLIMFIISLGVLLSFPSSVKADVIKNYNDGSTVYTNMFVGMQSRMNMGGVGLAIMGDFRMRPGWMNPGTSWLGLDKTGRHDDFMLQETGNEDAVKIVETGKLYRIYWLQNDAYLWYKAANPYGPTDNGLYAKSKQYGAANVKFEKNKDNAFYTMTCMSGDLSFSDDGSIIGAGALPPFAYKLEIAFKNNYATK
ncbi:hypothetical protein ACJQWY_01400 [Weissella kandleri]|uniref:hypothetical protein n=1 Tax=Weissella kandleri TaxID=1616 RepID=UPI00387EA516